MVKQTRKAEELWLQDVPAAYSQSLPPIVMIPTAEGIRQEPSMAAEQVEVDIRIHGFLADTAVTLVYRNTSRRLVVAGDLYFPLPEGAAVIGYALDVNGTMVDGVAVEKDRARQALEKSMKKKIDPGLVECAGGNVFKTRVFPVFPTKTRTIRIRFLSDLLQEERPGLFRLPFCFGEQIPEFRLRIEVVKGEGRPRILVPSCGNDGLGLSRRSRHAEVCLRDAVIREGVVVALPDVEKRRVWLERNENGETYFVLLDDPPKISSGEVPAPNQVAVYWDASGSREGSHEREIALLRAWFAQWRDAAIEVLLVPFRHALDETQTFTVVNGDAGPLLGAIEGLSYDAGTRLGLLSALPAKGDADLAFLFSDGINSLGRPNGKDRSNHPLYVISDSTAADHALLGSMAVGSGGEYINLDRVGIEDAASRIGRPDMKLLGVDCDPERVDGLIPGLPVPAPADGRLAVAGRLLKGPVDLTLRYGMDGKVLSTRSYRISRRGAGPGDVLRPYWAQRQLGEWLMEPEKHRVSIRNLGRIHGLTTPETSLVVLENLDQYLEHQIPPPASLPKMRARYNACIMEKSAKQRESQEKRREKLLSLWNERITWWEKDYPCEEGFTYVPPEEEAGFDLYDMWYNREKYPTVSLVDFFPQYQTATRGEGGPPDLLGRGSTAHNGEEQASCCCGEMNRRSAGLFQVEEWNPDAPYLAALANTMPDHRYATYLQERKTYGRSPGFYLECADFFYEHGEWKLALQVLTNLAELDLENAPLLRLLAHRLRQWDRLGESVEVFEEVLRIRPEDPHAYRDLALVLADRAEIRLARDASHPGGREDLAMAIALLHTASVTPWDRFQEIELTATLELNRLLAMAESRGIPHMDVDTRLVSPMDLDLRVVMSWDTDAVDLDLWVTEPSGEKVRYSHKESAIGGLLSRDMMNGYGPEEYLLRRAVPGSYIIEADFYMDWALSFTGPVTVRVDIFFDYGRPKERRKTFTEKLRGCGDTCRIAELCRADILEGPPKCGEAP